MKKTKKSKIVLPTPPVVEKPRPIRIFVVELLRWGDPEAHHYIWGVYSTYKKALKEAKLAMDMRAGKYDAFIHEGYADDSGKNMLRLYRRIHWGDEF